MYLPLRHHQNTSAVMHVPSMWFHVKNHSRNKEEATWALRPSFVVASMFTRAQARTFPRRERLERRKLRVVQAEFKIRHRTLNVQTQRRKMQAGPSPIHSDQPTCNNKATTNIQWSEPEVEIGGRPLEKLLSLVGAHMESGSVNKASLQFQNKVSRASLPDVPAKGFADERSNP
ncbi:hypothetical protein B0H14DRAFT_2593902 [Mycena olivaceomarginata]|nr:hypothetical protein B0H14DRAFT_2593902 [Mycena olivaceomarginata]